MSRESSLKKRPGTALSIVSEFRGSASLNPKPAAEELLLDQSLSPEKLVRDTRTASKQRVTPEIQRFSLSSSENPLWIRRVTGGDVTGDVCRHPRGDSGQLRSITLHSSIRLFC